MIYLDNHATTRIHPKVLEEMLPYFDLIYSNPSSSHAFGVKAKEVVSAARKTIADILNARPEHIFFTSGATESNNTILRGHKVIITSAIEHPSVLKCAETYPIRSRVGVEEDGSMSDFEHKVWIHRHTGFDTICSIHAANNEIGSVYDLGWIGSTCFHNDIIFHTDATQAIGKVKIDVEKCFIDALSFSAHKINGPKGVGVLYVRNPERVSPLLLGGLQESIRSGTLNVPGIVGTAKALELAYETDWGEVRKLRDYLFDLLAAQLNIELHGPAFDNRLPNNLNISIPGVKSEILVKGMSDVIVSSGSACKSGQNTVSDVLMVIRSKNPDCAVRFGLDRFNTKEEIEYAAERITQIAKTVCIGGNEQ